MLHEDVRFPVSFWSFGSGLLEGAVICVKFTRIFMFQRFAAFLYRFD